MTYQGQTYATLEKRQDDLAIKGRDFRIEVSDLSSVDLLCIPPYSIIPDCPIPSEAEHYRHLLPNQLEKGLDDLDLALLSVERMN